MGEVVLMNLVYDSVIYSNGSCTVQNQVIFWKTRSAAVLADC